MMRHLSIAAIAVTSVAASAAERAPLLPLPANHHVIAQARMTAGTPSRTFRIVALGHDAENGTRDPSVEARPRPLIIIEERNGRSTIVARNDQVVMKADEGGQCDPFDPEDAGGHIAVKGRYFTVENGVACGQHWTINITFRLDDRLGFVFSNTRTEVWTFNPDPKPGGEAMVRDVPLRVERANPRRPVRFAEWVPNPEN